MVTDNIGQLKDSVLRTERLASATYLVTGFLPEAEPVKWSLRAKVIELALLVASLNSEFIPAKVSQLVDEIILLLNLALLNPGVSEMNFSLLRQEYLGLRQALETQKIELLPPLNPTPSYKPARPTGGLQAKTSPSPRRELVLQSIRSAGGASSIKDIAQSIPGVSTKTVQRELSDLVAAGALKREGERRWSRYILLDVQAGLSS